MYANVSNNLHYIVLSIIKADVLNVNLLSFTNMDITCFAPKPFIYRKFLNFRLSSKPCFPTFPSFFGQS